MKINKKILAVLVSSALTGLSAHAQLPPVTDQGNAVPINTPVNVGQGNTYEKEVTPLLRDISKKKSLLELRKLDRELEKLEEETLTAQIERDKALNPPAPVNVTPNSPFQGLPPLISAPITPLPTVTEEDSIRVLMVYGFDNNLYAKVSNGSQGGYIVKKGDILPDGRLVTNITPNFLEVRKTAKSKNGNQKLYVSGPAPVKAAGSTSGGALPSTPPNAPPGPGTNILPPTGSVTPIAGTGAVPLGAGAMPGMTVKK